MKQVSGCYKRGMRIGSGVFAKDPVNSHCIKPFPAQIREFGASGLIRIACCLIFFAGTYVS